MQRPALLQAGAVLLLGALLISQQARCETKEFDWSELGVSLGAPKTSLGASSSAANNLRILVSPQRRMTKNYEFEYTNHSQPSSVAETTSYVIPGAGSGAYLSQSALSPNHSGHSSAYSALSASLASLKSRLSARGVTLSSSLADGSGSPASGLYSSGLYSSAADPTAQQQHQSASQQVAGGQAQPTYLSVTSQQDGQGASAYTVPPGQASDNKTIVLAIPAKINFLTGSKQQQQHQQSQQHQQQQQPQAQQVTVIQSDGQQTRAEYGTKQQLGVINGQEVVTDQSGQLVSGAADGQEHHQYVIVNSSPPQGDYHSHSVAASLSPSPVHAQTIYSSATLYQPSGGSVKYSSPSAYTQQQQQQPLTTIVQQQQQPKYFSMVEQSQPLGQQPVGLAAGPVQSQQIYETAVIEQQPQRPTYSYATYPAGATTTTTSSCPDTCNSADPRWRKYTVSKYKACCSRSAQYDSTLEQPSLDKVSEASSKYSDDAYYGYLYRKSRARRSRRQRARYSHHQRYQPAAGAASASTSPEEEELRPSKNLEESSGGQLAEGRPSRGQYSQELSSSTSPYMKYYRSRHQYAAPSDQLERDVEPILPPSSSGGSKYPKEARAYRRGRSRDLEAPLEPAQGSQNEPSEESDSVGPLSASSGYGRGSSAALTATGGSYGAGDYSVDGAARYAPASQAASDEEEPPRGGNFYGSDESIGAELDKNVDSDYSSGEPLVEPADEGPEAETTAYNNNNNNNKYQSSGRRRKLAPRNRRKQAGNKESYTKYYTGSGQQKKTARKNKYGVVAKIENSQQTNNATGDYESAQAGDYHGHSSSSSSVDSNDEDASYPSSIKNENNNENLESEKDAISSKYKASLNDTAVANLSKTTMHLKEILSLLEKKAQYTLGASNNGRNQNETSSSGNSAPATSTPGPLSLPVTTTTSSLYPMSSLFGSGSSYASSIPSEFLTSELSMKTPYRYEPSLSSSLGSSLSLPSSFGSLSNSDSFGLSSYSPSHGFGLHSGKPLSMAHGGPGGHLSSGGPHHGRKRRVNKNSIRYNELMLQKAAHGLGMSPSLLHAAAAKNRLLNPAYYPTLQHPYLYRGSSSSITNPYPYKNIHKNPYSSLFQGPVSSKLALSAAGLYSDESRGLHGLGGGGGGGGGIGGNHHDPLSNVASSLRPSTTMRLRTKPFVFQPQVLPIYSRHTILTQPLDVKA